MLFIAFYLYFLTIFFLRPFKSSLHFKLPICFLRFRSCTQRHPEDNRPFLEPFLGSEKAAVGWLLLAGFSAKTERKNTSQGCGRHVLPWLKPTNHCHPSGQCEARSTGPLTLFCSVCPERILLVACLASSILKLFRVQTKFLLLLLNKISGWSKVQ
jgi:hypothetical protein